MARRKSYIFTITGNILLVILIVVSLSISGNIYGSIWDLERMFSDFYLLVYSHGETSQEAVSMGEIILGQPIIKKYIRDDPHPELYMQMNTINMIMYVHSGITPLLYNFFKLLNFIDRLLLFILIFYSASLLVYVGFYRSTKQYNDSLSRLVTYSNIKNEQILKKISSELHDDVIQSLGAAIMMIEGDGSNKNAIESIQYSISSIRGLISSLNTFEVMKFDLSDLLHEYILKVNGTSPIPVLLSIDNHGIVNNFNSRISLHILRICQEAVSNAIRHSSASFIRIEVKANKQSLFVTITDNGIGFDDSQNTSPSGIGILSMKERVRDCEGLINIRSRFNEGTSVFVIIPIGNR